MQAVKLAKVTRYKAFGFGLNVNSYSSDMVCNIPCNHVECWYLRTRKSGVRQFNNVPRYLYMFGEMSQRLSLRQMLAALVSYIR